MIHKLGLILCLSLPLLAGGCSIYEDDYQYVPRPATASVRQIPPQSGAPPVSALASVIGVRRDDEKSGIPPSVEVRLQLNNEGSVNVTFDPHTLQLSDATLTSFSPPIARPAEAVTLVPLQSVSFTAYFPFPPGRSSEDTDLNSLQLRWTVTVDGRTVPQSVQFRRTDYYYRYYNDPYWYGPYPPYWYGGVVVVRRYPW